MAFDKHYLAADVEARRYRQWEDSGQFTAKTESPAQPYTIMMPPPNVTGSLHMGHALTMTLQDILTRYHRMRGFDALWLPGTDHAGIATQMVVERQLAEKGEDRRKMGRDAFLQKVWQWKEESGSTITRQLRRLGASADWTRERFTMDESLSRAVRKVFVRLFREGLIYKDKRLVNWDPKLQTAVSDLEVQFREVPGKLYHFRYPLADGTGYVAIATTRPETILADGAVAVHPEDARYAALVGRKVKLPIVDRLIPIIADAHVDPEYGSGCVKITAAHDPNDFEVARRHPDIGIPFINLMTPTATMNENCPREYVGLDRYAAREKVVRTFEELGLLDKIEEIKHSVPYGDRSGVVIEPLLTDQWYCDAKTLAAPAIEAVETGRTRFVPENWSKVYFEWMRNIQPWCISRQLWWGHQIPAWYGPDGAFFVAEDAAEASTLAEKHYGKAVELRQDEDVLDTWFSSALWPFSTLGWPETTADLKKYYPGDVLVTGFDIIFFWVARMMMMGLHFMDEVPFRTVYIHALVRDERGQKMSKTKGNVIDPLSIIDDYGCDAVRFTLASLAAPGRDIKLAISRVEGSRNFVTKLWNAARYAQMNGCSYDRGFNPENARHIVNRWVLGELNLLQARLHSAFDAYRFNEIAAELHRFAWGSFCDWYLEFTKPILTGGDAAMIAETRGTTAYILERLTRLLSPVMPYLASEIRTNLTGEENETMLRLPWPEDMSGLHDQAAMDELNWIVALITVVRSIRSELNVPAGAMIPLLLKGATGETLARLARHEELIKRMARLSSVTEAENAPKGSAQAVLGEATIILPLADVIDLAAERARLQKEAQKLRQEIEKLDAKLADEGFTAKAPEEVVDEQKERLAVARLTLERVREAEERLFG